MHATPRPCALLRSLLPANLRRQQLADKETLATEDEADESWWEKVQDLELNNLYLRKLRCGNGGLVPLLIRERVCCCLLPSKSKSSHTSKVHALDPALWTPDP